jgi:sugar phosphate isomerase/epimerase
MRRYIMAFLTTSALTPPEMVRIASELGYSDVGFRLMPNAPGAIQQYMLGRPSVMRETLATMKDTGIGVFDVEIVRMGPGFDLSTYGPLIDAAAELGAQALPVAGDDNDLTRLSDNYARLCECVGALGMRADVEFMPFTAIKTARDAERMLELAGSPASGGILVDTLHVDRSGMSVDDLRRLPRELIHYAQICDAPTLAKNGTPFTIAEMILTAREERLLPGEGGIDLGTIFKALPPDLTVGVEIPHAIRMPQAGPREWARQALAAAKSVIEP